MEKRAEERMEEIKKEVAGIWELIHKENRKISRDSGYGRFDHNSSSFTSDRRDILIRELNILSDEYYGLMG